MLKIKTAIIGMGKMGRIRHDALKRHGGFEITAVCDVSAENLNGYDCAVCSDWRECLDKSGVDAVFVCAFNNVVTDITIKSLDKGLNVFAEKPPGRSLEDAIMMKAAAERSGKVLKFGFNHRYHNSVIEAKTLIDTRLLGDVVCARGVYGKAGGTSFADDWRNEPVISGGGILLDQGIHMLDLLCLFLGDFSKVTATVDKLAWHDIPTEDSAFAILKTADGKVASLHSTAAQWKHKFDLDLICENGYIALNGLLTATRSYGEERISWYRKDLGQNSGKLGNPIEHNMCFYEDKSWDYETTEFYNAVVKGGSVTHGTPYDAVRVMRLIERIYNA
jgi:predicted dehydrogenase